MLRSLNIRVVLVHGASAQIERLGAEQGIVPSDLEGTGVAAGSCRRKRSTPRQSRARSPSRVRSANRRARRAVRTSRRSTRRLRLGREDGMPRGTVSNEDTFNRETPGLCHAGSLPREAPRAARPRSSLRSRASLPSSKKLQPQASSDPPDRGWRTIPYMPGAPRTGWRAPQLASRFPAGCSSSALPLLLAPHLGRGRSRASRRLPLPRGAPHRPAPQSRSSGRLGTLVDPQ